MVEYLYNKITEYTIFRNKISASLVYVNNAISELSIADGNISNAFEFDEIRADNKQINKTLDKLINVRDTLKNCLSGINSIIANLQVQLRNASKKK